MYIKTLRVLLAISALSLIATIANMIFATSEWHLYTRVPLLAALVTMCASAPGIREFSSYLRATTPADEQLDSLTKKQWSSSHVILIGIALCNALLIFFAIASWNYYPMYPF